MCWVREIRVFVKLFILIFCNVVITWCALDLIFNIYFFLLPRYIELFSLRWNTTEYCHTLFDIIYHCLPGTQAHASIVLFVNKLNPILIKETRFLPVRHNVISNCNDTKSDFQYDMISVLSIRSKLIVFCVLVYIKSIKLLYQWNIDCDYYKISNERTMIIIKALIKRLMFIACILHKPFWVYLDYVCFKSSVCLIKKLTTTGPLIKQWTKYSTFLKLTRHIGSCLTAINPCIEYSLTNL